MTGEKEVAAEFSASWRYELMGRNDALQLCMYCQQHEDKHHDGKCLFEPTEFDYTGLKYFLDEFIREGGILCLSTKGHTLTQRVRSTNGAVMLAQLSYGKLETDGPAILVKKEKRE